MIYYYNKVKRLIIKGEKMICPKCSGEMILGHIETTDAYVTYVINNKDNLPKMIN